MKQSHSGVLPGMAGEHERVTRSSCEWQFGILAGFSKVSVQNVWVFKWLMSGLRLQRTRAQTGVGSCPWLPSLALGVDHPSPNHVPSSWRYQDDNPGMEKPQETILRCFVLRLVLTCACSFRSAQELFAVTQSRAGNFCCLPNSIRLGIIHQ